MASYGNLTMTYKNWLSFYLLKIDPGLIILLVMNNPAVAQD